MIVSFTNMKFPSTQRQKLVEEMAVVGGGQYIMRKTTADKHFAMRDVQLEPFMPVGLVLINTVYV